MVRTIQLVDSRANIIVINRDPNRWYQWPLASVSAVRDHTCVVCSARD